MNSTDFSNPLADFLITSGLYSLVLIPIIMIVQWVSGDRLSPTTKHALWLILLIRLSLPALPESRLSLFNFASPTIRISPHSEFPRDTSATRSTFETQETDLLTPALNEPPSISFAEPTSHLEKAIHHKNTPESQEFSTQLPSFPSSISPQPSKAKPTDAEAPQTVTTATPTNWQTTLLGFWLAGVCLLFARVGYSWVQLRNQMHRMTEIKDKTYVKLIQSCHEALRLRHQVPVFETPLVNSPAICGFMKPRILFPQNFAQDYSHEELTHVLMHELAHQKRRDSVWNLWATLVQIIHWPNPLVWYATLRMRTDRELATDFLALKASQKDQSSAYGETILKSLHTVSHPKPIPGLMGISEDCKSLHRRFTMISRFQKHRRYSIAALTGVMVIMTLITLTDARTKPIVSGGGFRDVFRRLRIGSKISWFSSLRNRIPLDVSS